MEGFLRHLYENPEETLAANNILVHIGNLEQDVAAFVYRSSKGRYHIVVNDSLNIESRTRVFLHEIAHIRRDLPKIGYIVSIDMQKTYVESQADLFAREVATGYGGK